MKKVTVFSASGRPGRAQVRQLLSSGYDVRAVSRDPSKLDKFDSLEIVSADYNDPDSVVEACSGSDIVFYTTPSFEESHKGLDFAATVGNAARKAGVSKLIFNTCCWGTDEEVGEVGYDGSRLIINTLAQTGIPLVTFQPVLFMDNLLTSWARTDILDNDLYTYPHNPNLEASWICLDDVAKFMIAAIGRNDLNGKRIVLGGPEIFTPQRVADLLSGHFGKPIKYEMLDLDLFSERLFNIFYADQEGADLEAFSFYMTNFYKFNNESEHKPFKVDMESVLKLIPVKLTTFSEWIKKQDWNEKINTTAG